MSAPTDTEWSEQDIDRLQDMWDVQRLPASQIAVALGRSRSAIVGKVRRLNFSRRRRSPVFSFVPEKRQRLSAAMSNRILAQVVIIHDTRSVTARMMGDPLPGRSALDQKKRTFGKVVGQAGGEKRLILRLKNDGALSETAIPISEAVA
jgi:hypothetical protein